MEKISRFQIEQLIENGSELNFQNADLSKSDLSRLDLSGANFEGAKPSRFTFSYPLIK
jgi:uncharacterized protein YjbI with pentapeptide repeats